jgi:hypothetical protein
VSSLCPLYGFSRPLPLLCPLASDPVIDMLPDDSGCDLGGSEASRRKRCLYVADGLEGGRT